MYLPEAAARCIRMLEDAGFSAYAVGGCVRDALLGIDPHDYDLCTSATPPEICRVFSGCRLIHNGEKHGTIGVVMDDSVYEITTFRTEGDYRDSRHPGWVKFVPTVEEDLARRDFTVNAMAYSPTRGYIDPWGGREDLQRRTLRAVGTPSLRFGEDALRILRGVRFAVRYHLTPEAETRKAMETQAPLMAHLAAERVFEELCKLLPLVTAEDLLRFAPILTEALPELKPCVGFLQYCPYHRYDVYTHIAHVVEAVPGELPLRWAALLHDIGKPATFTRDETGRGHFIGHASVGGEIADSLLRRLKAPTKLRQQVVFLTEHHMVPWEADKRLLRRRLGKYGPENVQMLLTLQAADFSGKGTGTPLDSSGLPQVQALLEQVLEEEACFSIRDLAVDGRDLMAIGYPACPGLGKCLSFLLTQVQEELLPNTREELLSQAEQNKERFLSDGC